MTIKKCAACGWEFEAYNDKTPCPNCVSNRKARERKFDADRNKLERLNDEINELGRQDSNSEAYLAKKQEYQDWKNYMLNEYGTYSREAI